MFLNRFYRLQVIKMNCLPPSSFTGCEVLLLLLSLFLSDVRDLPLKDIHFIDKVTCNPRKCKKKAPGPLKAEERVFQTST